MSATQSAPDLRAQTPIDADYLTPNWMQNEAYPATADRSLIAALFSSSGGIIGPNDFKVSPRAAGANLSVDVAAGAAAVPGSDAPGQGTYLNRLQAVKNFPLAAAPGTGLQRYDLVVLRNYDDAVLGASGHAPFDVEVLTGTAAASPIVPALPTSAIPLAVVGPITPTTAQVTAGMITDRRYRGTPGTLAYAEVTTPQTGFLAGTWGDVTGTTVTFVVPGTRRIRYSMSAPLNKGSGDTSGQVVVGMWDSANAGEAWELWTYCVQATNTPVSVQRVVTLAAGIYSYHLRLYSLTSYINTSASALCPVVLHIEDIGS